MMITYSFLPLIFHQNATDPLLILKQISMLVDIFMQSVCKSVSVCLCGFWDLYHLAGWPWGKVLNHLVHLFKLCGHCLDLRVQLLVLSVLVIEHSLVLVPLLLWAYAGVFPRETGQKTTHCLGLLATFTLQLLSSRDRETGQNRVKDECSQMLRGARRKTAPGWMWSEPEVTVHLWVWQWSETNQDNTGVSSGQVSVCPWVFETRSRLKPEHLWRELKMSAHRHFPSKLMEPERICQEDWANLQKTRLYLKTQSCNCFQRSFYKVLI